MSKRPPTLTESERAAVGAALCDPSLAEVLTAELTDTDFSTPVLQRAFVAVKAIGDDGLEVNPVSVQDRSGLSHDDIGQMVKAGRPVTQSQLTTLIADIKRVSGLRTVYNACQNTSSKVGSGAKLEEVLEGLERELYRLDRNGASEAADGAEVMQGVVNGVLERFQGGGGPEVATGLKALDKAILGLRPGKMIVVAARPGMGKTALADNLRRTVVDQGFGAVQFSLEMSKEELLERELAFRAQVNLRKVIAAKEMDPNEVERVRGAAGRLVSGRWFIDDRTYSIAGIRRRARIVAGRMARAGIKLGLVVLDYIQLAGDNGDGREQAVSAISRGCKLMAKELGCTVLALSQLNRACESRDDRRPLLSDIRESGSIEQDADAVIMVYRESVYDGTAPEDAAELILRKHRSGPTGTVHVRYNGRLVCFEDLKTDAVLTENVLDT